MTDPTSGPVPRCPWCSATLPVPGSEQCPSCGAQLVTVPGSDTEIRGVTTLDAEAILRARSELNRPRSRLLSLITGHEGEAASAREHQESLAQPSGEVRREMMRLEAEARRAAEEAERTALRAAAMAELGITVDDLAAAEAADVAGTSGEGAETGGHAGAGEPASRAEATAGLVSGSAGEVVPDAVDGAWPEELQPPDEPVDNTVLPDA